MLDTSLQRKIYACVAKPTHHTALQIPRALLVSVLAAAINMGVLILLTHHFLWSAVWAGVVSYLLGGVVQYTCCSLWVFPNAPNNHSIGVLAFLLLALVGLGISSAVIWLICAHWNHDPIIGNFIAQGCTFCWNFTSRKYLLFRDGSVLISSTPVCANIEQEHA
jgi:putative flippase GtrA